MNNTTKIKDKLITPRATLLEALRRMDGHRSKMLFVIDDDRFESLLTIGDIQRAIIRGVGLDAPVSDILQRDKIYASTADSPEAIKAVMQREMLDCMPVIDERGDIADVLFWHDIFATPSAERRAKIDLPVVIMAGGKGTRLKPITNVLPKPLVPVGEKTIVEVIMDQFESIGCHRFYMSVGYKADMLRYYLGRLSYDITYIEEAKPLGTIGSVALLRGKVATPFFVTNCDSINEQDYRDVYDYHVANKNDLTLVAMVKSFRIPYGVVETGADGLMTGLREKPEHTYMVNTGVYILQPELIDEIPEGEFFHVTQLMERVKSRGGRVGCFPVSERAWRDMGEWPEYLRMIHVL